MTERVLLHIGLQDSHGTGRISHQVNKKTLNEINSKLGLLNVLYDTTNESLLNPKNLTRTTVTRWSKKHKTFVPLDSKDDFDQLRRSLKVKNKVKLEVCGNSGFASKLEPSNMMVQDLEQAGPAMRGIFPIEHHVACNVCSRGGTLTEIIGERFKCIICEDFDLCSTCFRSGKEIDEHFQTHPMAAISAVTNSILGETNGSALSPEVSTTSLYSSIRFLCHGETPVPKNSDGSSPVAFDFNRVPGRVSRGSMSTDDTRPDHLRETVLDGEVNGGELKIPPAKQQCKRWFSRIVIKSVNLAQLIIKNENEEALDLRDLVITIRNLCDEVIATSHITSGHELSPGCSARFNVRVGAGHLKYPFNIQLKTASFLGTALFPKASALVCFVENAHRDEEVKQSLETSKSESSLIIPRLSLQSSLIAPSSNMEISLPEDELGSDYSVIDLGGSDPDNSDDASDFELLSATELELSDTDAKD